MGTLMATSSGTLVKGRLRFGSMDGVMVVFGNRGTPSSVSSRPWTW